MTKPDRRRLALTVSSPTEEAVDETPARIPYVPWVVAALAGGAAAAALGWLVVALLVVAGWLTALHTPLSGVLSAAGQGWLAAHGVAAGFDGLVVGIPPLGLTGLAVAACVVAAHHAAGQATPGNEHRDRWLAGAKVAGTTAGACIATSFVIASLVGTPAQAVALLPGAAVIAVTGSAFGALRGLALDPLERAPEWVRGLPAAVGAGLAVMALGSAAALATALIANAERVAGLHLSLEPDAAGHALLVIVQLVYLPNLVLWAGSYALGAGLRLGVGTLVAPGTSALGTLPAIPVSGALPTDANPWTWGWVALGPLAGGLAAWWLLRRRHTSGVAPHLGWWTGQAAVAGTVVGLVWVAGCWVAGGDLGEDRLVDLGPRFPDLLWFGIPPLAASAAIVGLTYSWWLRRRRRTDSATEQEPDPVGVLG